MEAWAKPPLRLTAVRAGEREGRPGAGYGHRQAVSGLHKTINAVTTRTIASVELTQQKRPLTRANVESNRQALHRNVVPGETGANQTSRQRSGDASVAA